MNLLTIDTNITPSVRLMGHVVYNKPWKHFKRTIDEYLLYIVKSGNLYIAEGDTKYTLQKGDILLLEPNIEHMGFKESCCHYYYFHFKHPKIQHCNDKPYADISKKLILKRKTALSSNYLDGYGETDSIFYFPKYHHYRNVNELMALLIDADNDFYSKYEGYKRMASLKFLEILIKISRDYTSTKIDKTYRNFSKTFVKCQKILNYLNCQYVNKITSKDIEQIFESNYDYINRVFRKMTGYTILNYLNNLRINKAKDLFNTCDMKISEVCYLVGIDDPYYFSKIFKKYTNMSPSQYIKLRSKTKI